MPSSKAAASEGPKAYPLGYVEGLNNARTLLADFFSILLGRLHLHRHDPHLARLTRMIHDGSWRMRLKARSS